jgi:hypothetical protein
VCDIPYYGILSLDDNTHLWMYDTVLHTYTEVHILEGHLLLWRGDVFHAGAACKSARIFISFNAACSKYSATQTDVVYLDYCTSACGTRMDYSRMPELFEKASNAAASI